MESILLNIVQKNKETQQHLFDNFSPATFVLSHRPPPIPITPLRSRDFFVIAETKKASPSKGIIRENYNPAAVALEYQQAGASAISVITEEHFFLGHKTHLQQVKNTVKLPILRKDFIFHPYHVYESYNLGADFILLIAAILQKDQLENLHQTARSLGMETLIDVHNETELDSVLPLKPTLIGINNRDLKTFNVDIQTSFQLKRIIPPGIHVISESGIHTRQHLEELQNAGFAGALIGESLLRHPHPGAALFELLNKTQGAFFVKTAPCTPGKAYVNF